MARPLKNRISRRPIACNIMGQQQTGCIQKKYNWTYKKTGHVFQGRYKDSYLLEFCRYVVLNPVRAHIEHGYTQKEIADYLRFYYATVSRAIKRIGTDNV